MKTEEYLQIVKELKQSVDVLLQGFYDLKVEVEKLGRLKVDLSRQFSILNIPSRGVCYENKKKSLLVRYITANEEHVLCDTLLMESGIGAELLLNSIIMDNDVDVKNLLLGDFQAILIFLRSTSYGDVVDFPVTCPHCGKEGEGKFNLSQLKFKEPKIEPNENGKYILFFEDMNIEVVIAPMTLAMEIEKNASENDDDFFILKNEYGEPIKIKKEKSLSLVYNIESINGVTDKSKIKKHIKNLPKRHVDYIVQFIEDNHFGVDDKISVICEFCGEEFFQKIAVGYDFLKLPPNYKENIYEECFLLSYYGKSITRQDAINMPVVERKWHIRRIKEEVDKKNEAEKQAVNKAKSGKGKF